MADDSTTQVLLDRWSDGESGARDVLLRRLHPELTQIAAARLRGERNSSLSTSDLINDAVLRLIQVGQAGLKDRAHVIALSSRMMRNILVDYARMKSTDRRQHQKIELCTRIEGEQRFELQSLVEMRYFGGMTVPEVAEATGLSEATVKRRWQTARAWLTDALMNPIDG
jgi:DNA-directed RNA polymerase specialized sigma24 family protein